jgi:ankyrin repeat protein
MSYLRALSESMGSKANDGKKISQIASKRFPEPAPAIELAKLRKDRRCVAALEGKYKLAAAPKNAGKVDALVKAGNAPAIARVIADQNPNMRDELGWTPLHHAVASGQLEVIATLVDAKASLVAQTRTGRTPLTLAVEKNQPMAVLRLIAAGANPKAADGSGDNAISLAKKLDRPEIELLLMDAGTKKK